jgi:hypothetical protein
LELVAPLEAPALTPPSEGDLLAIPPTSTDEPSEAQRDSRVEPPTAPPVEPPRAAPLDIPTLDSPSLDDAPALLPSAVDESAPQESDGSAKVPRAAPLNEPALLDKPPVADEAKGAKEPVKAAKQLSPEMARLRNKIRTCLTYYYQRPTSIDERSPWGIMHSLIAFGVDTELLAGKQRVNAIGWLCYNRPCRGMTLMTVKDGRLAMRTNGPGYQGHDGQLLSMLALSGVKSTYPIRVEGHEFTVADLVDFEQRTCKPKSELTFQLIGLAHYLDSDATWKSDQGETWSIPRLIREELAQPVNGAACGGTHRLIALSMAVKTRQKRGEPLDGEWLRAQKFVSSYQKHAFKLQNRDGSFSTSWLEKRDDAGTVDRRIQTTGHILEWLVFSLPQKDLTDPRIVRSVNYLASTLLNGERNWEIGPRGHALRALVLYSERVFGDMPGDRSALLARRPGK